MRKEFSKQTKRQAWDRSGGNCEAVGVWYNLKPNERCNIPLFKAVQYDHIHSDENDGDNTLENCAAVCVTCHAYKTAKIDIPRAAKTARLRDKHIGATRPKKKIQSRGFRQQPSNTKYVNEGY